MSEYFNNPDFYYKFVENNKYLIPNLEKHQLIFSNPYNFNDPFDCGPLVLFDSLSSKDWVNVYKNLYPNEEASDDKIKTFIEKIQITSTNKDKVINNFFTKKFKNILRVCSFSKTYDNNLMWGHYASKHNGICLVFESVNDRGNDCIEIFSKKANKFKKLEKIIYSTKMPTPINLLKFINNNAQDITMNNGNDEENILKLFYLTKSTDWMYENEYRLILNTINTNNNNDFQIYNYNLKQLKAIIFGYYCKTDFIESIRNVTDNRIDYFKCEIKNDEFKLNINRII